MTVSFYSEVGKSCLFLTSSIGKLSVLRGLYLEDVMNKVQEISDGWISIHEIHVNKDLFFLDI